MQLDIPTMFAVIIATTLVLALSVAVFSTGCDQDVVDVAISPGGRYLAYTTEKAGLLLVDTVTSAIRVIEVKNARPGGLAWSPTGARGKSGSESACATTGTSTSKAGVRTVLPNSGW